VVLAPLDSDRSCVTERCEAGSCVRERIVDVAPGYFFSCALLESSRVLCWGTNEYGSFGPDYPLRASFTTLTLNGDGYVAEYQDAAGSTATFEYETGDFAGLMNRMVDLRGREHVFTYDTLSANPTGRLITDRGVLDTPTSSAPLQTLSVRAPWEDPVTETTWDRVTLSGPVDPGLNASARDTHYLLRSPNRATVIREVRHGAAWTRSSTPADGSAIFSESWDGTTSTSRTEADPRPGFGRASSYVAESTAVRPTATGSVSSTITTTRTYNPSTSALTTVTTLPPATGTTPTVVTATVAPTSTGFLSTVGTSAALTTHAYTDTRGRVVRIERPGMQRTCIEYPSPTAVRPSLIRTSPLCSPSSSLRREIRFEYNAGTGLRWLTAVREGAGTPASYLSTTMVPDVRGWSDNIRLPGRSSVIDIAYDADGNITSFTPPTRSAHTFTYTPRGGAWTETPPALPGLSGPEVIETVYRPNGTLDHQTYRNGATLHLVPDPDTGYLSNLYTVGDSLPYNISFSNDAGGRPIEIESAMGDMELTWRGPLLERERWIGWSRGATGTITRTVSAAMLLTREAVTLPNSTGTVTTNLDYFYDTDRMLTRAGRTVSAHMHLTRSFGVGITLTARSGSVTPNTTSDITTTSIVSSLGEYTSATSVRNGLTMFEEHICARDDHGRVTSRGERARTSAGGITVRVYRYDYHPTTGFLTRSREYVPQANGTGNGLDVRCSFTTQVEDRSFAYDQAGNRTQYTFNAADQVTSGGRLYDSLGQLRGRTLRVYAYDSLGALRAAERSWPASVWSMTTIRWGDSLPSSLSRGRPVCRYSGSSTAMG